MMILTKVNTAHFFLVSGLGGGVISQIELPDQNFGEAEITLIQFLNQNASGLGVIVSIIGVSLAAAFYVLNYLETKRHHHEIIAKQKKQLPKL